jgi:hypothetical protein
MGGAEAVASSESIYEALVDVGTRTTAIDWSRKFAYPSPRTTGPRRTRRTR